MIQDLQTQFREKLSEFHEIVRKKLIVNLEAKAIPALGDVAHNTDNLYGWFRISRAILEAEEYQLLKWIGQLESPGPGVHIQPLIPPPPPLGGKPESGVSPNEGGRSSPGATYPIFRRTKGNSILKIGKGKSSGKTYKVRVPRATISLITKFLLNCGLEQPFHSKSFVDELFKRHPEIKSYQANFCLQLLESLNLAGKKWKTGYTVENFDLDEFEKKCDNLPLSKKG